MKFCGKCGFQNEDLNQFCEGCGAPLKQAGEDTSIPPMQTSLGEAFEARKKLWTDAVGIQSPASRPISQKASNGINGMPVLSENETIVKTYHCTEIRMPRSVGSLTVTNQRVVFHSLGSSSRVVKEVPLDSVSGIDCYYGMFIRWMRIVWAAIVFFAGYLLDMIYNKISYSDSHVFMIVAIIVALVLVVLSVNRAFTLKIFSTKSNESPISIGGGPGGRVGNGALYTLVGKPSRDTEVMMDNLGALVHDLQILGDHAIEKWS